MEMFAIPLMKSFDSFQIHYYFNDESHKMDAFIQNRCEKEFLFIVSEISKKFEIEIEILTEPLADGGLKRKFKIIEKSARKYPLTAGLIVAFLISIFTKPMEHLSSKMIDKFFEDNELIELQKENLRKENRNLDIDFELKINQLPANNVIRRRVSNFYEELDTYPKVEKVSFQKVSENIPIENEIYIHKNKFKNFILPTNDLEPQDLENVAIEIISPVLKKGKYKWRGIYQGQVISFYMKSKDFKTKVQNGQIKFINGSAIKADVQIDRYLDGDGNEKIKNIDVIAVTEYIEQGKSIETEEGKKKRRDREAEKSIMKFDFGNEYE